MTTSEPSLMPIAIRRFERLGSFLQLVSLLEGLNRFSPSPRIDDLRAYCADQSVDFAVAFHGILALNEYLDIIQISDGLIAFGPEHSAFVSALSNENALRSVFVGRLLARLHKDGVLGDLIPLAGIRYDSADNSVSVSNSYIPLKYSGIKDLLVSLGLFELKSVGLSHLRIGAQFQTYFENDVIGWVRAESGLGKKALSQDRLDEILRMKAARGELAEDFVLKYELARLCAHPSPSRIRIVGRLDVTCGYDIASYDDENSTVIDRFIEVKSYVGGVGFYWSRNELETARRKGAQYYLYLVDSEKLAKAGYMPAIIRNPYEAVYMNDGWVKDVQSWYLNPIQ